jgi:cation-transporting P-type ATPase C
LIAADVGLAMPRGADLARATADIVLLDEHLQYPAGGPDAQRRHASA